MPQIKVGSKFKLGPWVWEVYKVEHDVFCAKNSISTIYLPPNEAEKLDWIEEPLSEDYKRGSRETLNMLAAWIDRDDKDESALARLRTTIESLKRDYK